MQADTSNSHDEPQTNATSSRRAVGALGMAVGAVVLAGLAIGCLAWVADDRLFLADLVAQFTAHSAAAGVVIAAWWFIRRRWTAATLALSLAVVAIAMAVVPGRDLTEASGASGPEPATGGPVRILLYNAWAENANQEGVRSVIRDADADIVGLLETPGWLIDELRAGGEWRARYPHYFVSDRAAAGFKVVLSKWPQHGPGGRLGAQRTAVDGMRRALIDRPDGVFAFTLFHPRSPRSPERWAQGNEQVRSLARAHRGAFEALGVAHVAAADMNATPTGWRSRALATAGLRRAKPLLVRAGTIPAGLPWPLSIAIDDVVVSDDVSVRTWAAIDGAGSDHRAVLVDLWVPAPTNPVSLERAGP